MKKKPDTFLIFLYVMTVLSLCYTCYIIFNTYEYVTALYAQSSQSAGAGTIFHYIVMNAAEPFFWTAMFYVITVLYEKAAAILKLNHIRLPQPAVKKAASPEAPKESQKKEEQESKQSVQDSAEVPAVSTETDEDQNQDQMQETK